VQNLSTCAILSLSKAMLFAYFKALANKYVINFDSLLIQKNDSRRTDKRNCKARASVEEVSLTLMVN